MACQGVADMEPAVETQKSVDTEEMDGAIEVSSAVVDAPDTKPVPAGTTKPVPGKSIYARVFDEISQTSSTRTPLLQRLGDAFNGRSVVAYYTSFNHDVEINDPDVAMMEDVLIGTDASKGLTLIVCSPGGSALAAERLVNVCRQYSNDDFEVIIPKQAKSAATLVSFGSNKIYMSRTSELGPVDPQIFQKTVDGYRFVPADLIIGSYRKLMKEAIACKGNADPYLQQLTVYDPRTIAQIERDQKLGKDIAVSVLQKKMLKGKSKTEILRKIRPFTDAGITGSHGRPIFIDTARACDLKVEEIDINSTLWTLIMELHVRAEMAVSRDYCKLIESVDHQFAVPAPRSM